MADLTPVKSMDNRADTNARHLQNPKVGDYWHEMFTPILVVIGRGADAVMLCDEIERYKDGGWFWRVSKVKTLSLAELRKRLTYDSENLKDKCWCDVVPESQPGVRKMVIEFMMGNECP